MLIKRCKKRWALPDHEELIGNWIIVDQYVHDPLDFTMDLYYCWKRKQFALLFFGKSIDFLEISFGNNSEIVYRSRTVFSHSIMPAAFIFKSDLLKRFIDHSEFMVSHGAPHFFINLFSIRVRRLTKLQKLKERIKNIFSRK